VVHPNVLRGWCQKADAGQLDGQPGADVKDARAREIARLKRELNRGGE
jgi:transposase-like protein